MNHQPKCTIVMYHYIRNMAETDYPQIKGLLVDKFVGQLDYILNNYTVIRLEEYIEFLRTKKGIPHNSCILTFDDGFKDHYLNVFLTLKEKKIPAYFFPTTQPLTEFIVPAVHKIHFLLAKIGSRALAEKFNHHLKSDFPRLAERFFIEDKAETGRKYRYDDPLTANLKHNVSIMPYRPKNKILKQIFLDYFEDEKEFCEELYMNWDEMREMIAGGMSFGGHSHTHSVLSQLTKNEQTKEIKNSTRILEKELKTKIRLFSYPYGSFNKITIDILRREGYICGVTVDVGINKGGNIDPFKLKRLDTNDLPFQQT